MPSKLARTGIVILLAGGLGCRGKAGTIGLEADAGSPRDRDAGPSDRDAGPSDRDAGPSDGQVGRTLALQGSSPLRGAAVRAKVGAESFEATADDTGRFLITVTGEPTALVVITIRGTGVQSAIELATVCDSFMELADRSGRDASLNEQTEPTLALSELSTLRYTILRAANGGRVPATATELRAAEAKWPEPMWGWEMLAGAGLLRLIATGQQSVAAGTTTLDLVHDWRGFVRRVAALSVSGLDLEEPQDQLVREGPSLAPFAAADLGTHYVDFLAARVGFVPRGGTRWVFEASGRGAWSTTIGRGEYAPFTWTIDHGAVEVQYDRPISGATNVELAKVLALIADPQLREEARRAAEAARIQSFWIPYDQLGAELVRVAGNHRVDWVLERERVRWYLDRALPPIGVTLPPGESIERWSSTTWHHSQELTSQRFERDRLIGTWLVQARLPSQHADIFETYVAGAPVFSATRARFEADGTLLIDGLDDTALRGRWQLLEDGSAELVYPGVQAQSVRLVHEEATELGLLHEIRSEAGAVQTAYDRSHKVEPLTPIAEADLVNAPKRYWQSALSTTFGHPDGDGSAGSEAFGFRFGSNGSADRVQFDPRMGTIATDQLFSFSVENGVVAIEQRYDRNRAVRCARTDPSCFAYRRRTWQPIARDRDRLYVLEQETYIADHASWRSFHWDDSRGAWVNSTGAVMDPNRRVDLILPRVNAYYVVPVAR